jgi:hypothetical protein
MTTSVHIVAAGALTPVGLEAAQRATIVTEG